MTPTQALRILDAHSPAGENWPLHSRQVARVAVRLSEALRASGAQVNRDRQEVQALLHDIGRSRTHGPLHGWSGFTLLKSMSHAAAGRGCLTHWLKGRTPEEAARTGSFSPEFMQRVYAEMKPSRWELGDSIMSVADASVRHSTIVPLEERHADLLERYGESEWLRRAVELGEQHAREIAEAAGRPLDDLLGSLYGDCLERLPAD